MATTNHCDSVLRDWGIKGLGVWKGQGRAREMGRGLSGTRLVTPREGLRSVSPCLLLCVSTVARVWRIGAFIFKIQMFWKSDIFVVSLSESETSFSYVFNVRNIKEQSKGQSCQEFFSTYYDNLIACLLLHELLHQCLPTPAIHWN